jgi:hypothetical protein
MYGPAVRRKRFRRIHRKRTELHSAALGVDWRALISGLLLVVDFGESANALIG